MLFVLTLSALLEFIRCVDDSIYCLLSNILSCDIVEVVRFDQTAAILFCCVVVKEVPLLSHAVHTLYKSSLSKYVADQLKPTISRITGRKRGL